MKEKIYIIFKNNEEEYDDYSDWITEIYKDKERAEKRFVELVKTNQYKKDRTIRKVKYNEDIGAYRIEEHEIENETKRNEVIDTNSDSIEEDIEILEGIIKGAKDCINAIYSQMKVKNDNDEDIQYYKKEIQALEHILSDYKRVLKENEELKSENSRLKVIRYSTEYGTENIHLITKSDLVQIDINRYIIEIEDGKFVDLKQIYQENKELHKEIVRIKSLDIYKLVDDCETGQLISAQTIKNKIENLKKQDHEWTEELSEPDSNFKVIDRHLKRIKNQIDILQELLESEKK